jgi:hypothetical protein
MISVITPTVRNEGISIVEKALRRQTFKDFEWIIVCPQHLPLSVGMNFMRINDPPKNEGDIWTLNKAYNEAIRQSKGDLIVSWQDYTFAKPDALEKYWFHFQEEPKTLVTGVGNKYEDDSWSVITWKDPREREDEGSYYPCYFQDIEANFCAVPKRGFYDVGGFDEFLDRYYGMDFYSVVDRLSLVGGWDFKIDQTNKSYSLVHGRPERWEELNALHGPYQERRKNYIANPVLEYLQ